MRRQRQLEVEKGQEINLVDVPTEATRGGEGSGEKSSRCAKERQLEVKKAKKEDYFCLRSII